ncbi:hypothetical protein ACFLX2_00270 [Candidatus Dependentiae bacterium]
MFSKKIVLTLLAFLMAPIFSSAYKYQFTHEDYLRMQKNWRFYGYVLQGKNSFLYLHYYNGNPSVTYVYYDELPDTLTEHEKNLFLPHKEVISNAERDVFVLHYGGRLFEGQNKRCFRKGKFFRDSREFTSSQGPETMEPDQLAAFIKDHNVLFYTSGGMSGRWNYQQLMGACGIDSVEFRKDDEPYCKWIVQNRKKICDTFGQFYEKILSAVPTNAHLSLATIAKKLNAPVCTNCADRLHYQTGIKASRVWLPRERENLSASLLSSFDAIVCIGLDVDTYGFLAWYKELNPDGKIIAINPDEPSYLGEEDIFVEGDIQQLVPAVADSF